MNTIHNNNNSNILNNSMVVGPLGDSNSLLGVIVDRSSFDEDDELTTFGAGKDSPSILMNDDQASDPEDELPPQDVTTSTGVVMRNGKVRRKLRWKPRFGRKQDSTDANMSSNASVVSALTSKSTATSRSTSTNRSFLSHFSRRSGNSFHTFHSTETPVVTNKANRPKAPQTVMRPNYQDSFDAKHSTIDTEGAHRLPSKRRGSFSSSFSSKLDSVSETMDSTLPEQIDEEGDNPLVQISPRSPISEASPRSPRSNDFTKPPARSSPVGNNSSTKKAPDRPSLSNGSKLPKPKRPPLFKRRLRNKMSSSSNKDGISNTSNKSLIDNTEKGNKPLSPTDASQASGGGHTAPTASLSASISLERENSILPVLSGDEYEEDRRIGLPPSKNNRKEEEKKDDEVAGLDDLLLQEGVEESSVSPTVAEQSVQSGTPSIQSGYQSVQSGSTAAISFSSAPAALQGRRVPSTGRRGARTPPPPPSSAQPNNRAIALTRDVSSASSPSNMSNVSAKSLPTPHKRYNRPVDRSSVTDSRKGSRSTVPVDLDEGAFLEAEHNLRAIHEMAAEHLAHGEYEEAIEVFEEILRGQQERYGQDHYRVGTALHNLGIVYLKKGDYQKAIEICGRAVKVRKEALVPNHPDVAVSLAQLGVAHLESRQFNLALNAFRDALHIRQNFLGPRHPKCSKILNNIGCALYSMEEYVEAKKAFDEALDIQRDTLRNLPSTEGAESNGMQSNSLLLSTASTLCNIGSIRLRWGEFDEAAIALDEALLVSNSLGGEGEVPWSGFYLMMGLSFRFT
jgi:TolA-binding protein